MKTMMMAGIFACALAAQVPEGWALAGSRPADYQCSIDRTTNYNGMVSTYIKSKPGAETDGFGTMSQYFSAVKFAGKRVRFSAELMTDNIRQEGKSEGWAGLWLRIDKGQRPLIMDNMRQTGTDRSAKGTTPWRKYAVVLDVDPEATGMGMGVILSGSGAVWISNIKFEVVGVDVPVTVAPPPVRNAPENLGFERGEWR